MSSATILCAGQSGGIGRLAVFRRQFPLEVWVRVPPLAPDHLANEMSLVSWGARRVHQATW